MKKKVLIVFGTRPEGIKMAPLVKEFEKHSHLFDVKVCITGQHREMLDQVLSFFEIKPHFDLNLMRPNQNLYSLTSDIILKLKPVLEIFDPNFVFVHGDTTTAMAASIASFYYGAKICHVEAGLRTFDIKSPFPEEMNRSVISVASSFHFAPTPTSKENLLKENKKEENIIITGNTVIDSLIYTFNKVNSDFNDAEISSLKAQIIPKKKIILVTGHRRENHGKGFLNICKALREIANKNEDCEILYPVHLNPNVQKPVYKHLKNVKNIKLLSPLSYPAFVWLMGRSYLILTDSGGVQEEAPSLGVPVLVMREKTERPEAVAAGTVILVGVNVNDIVEETNSLLRDSKKHESMSKLHNPYGDGKACEKILKHIMNI